MPANVDLAQLIQLQALDLQIRELTRQRNDLPLHIESLQLEVTQSEKSIQDGQTEMERLRQERRLLEADVESLRPKLSRYKEQLMAVKTNKEYTAMLSEIEACTKEISSREDAVLAIMEKMESQEEVIGSGQQSLASSQDVLRKQQEELNKQAAQLDRQIQSLHSDREQVLSGISEPSLGLYSRIAEARRGVAVAQARDQSCQMCHVRLRLQIFNEIRKNEQIITCESCNRILYFVS